MQTKLCPNCGAEVSQRFCGQCGAKIGRKDISLNSLVQVLVETVTNWEQKMMVTLKKLVIEPGRVAHSVIEGEQRTYYHPVKFLLFWASINVFVAVFLKVSFGALDPNLSPVEKAFDEFIRNYISLIYMAAVPAMSLGPYLIFKKCEPRFVHYNVIMCYVVGFGLLINIPSYFMVSIWRETEFVRNIIGPAFPILYCTYFFHNYFKSSLWRTILAGILAALLLYINSLMILSILYVIMSSFY